MLIAWSILGVSIFPCFWMLNQLRSGLALYVACASLDAASTLAGTVALVAITESLPRHVRAGGFGLIYSLSISVFGGSTQFMAAWLTRLTGNPLVPAWYMIGGLTVGLIALANMHETAPIKAGLDPQ